MSKILTSKAYVRLLSDIKERIRSAQYDALRAVNRELIALYWDIGRMIVERQKKEGWGKSIVETLAGDLHKEFPGTEGFSSSNISRMRAFYIAWKDIVGRLPVRENAGIAKANISISAQPVPKLKTNNTLAMMDFLSCLPWGHHVVLLFKIKEPEKRIWYVRKAFEHGWSRPVLIHQIESNAFSRQGKAVTNFKATLPPLQSDRARQIIKDPYNFDFLTLKDDFNERILEKALIDEVQKFLLELGTGFSFVGRQVSLNVGDQEYYMDLLFYHLKLRCFVVIELKTEAFKPEFAGKMNFYLSAVDDRLRHADDQPSIGIILCKTRNKLIAEYALRDVKKPVGVSSYMTRLVEKLPKKFERMLPSVKDIERELS